LTLTSVEELAAAERGLSGVWDKIKDAVTDVPAMISAGISAFKDVWEQGWELLEWAAGVMLNILLHQLLAMITNDIVNWIENGKTPRFMSEGIGSYLKDAADNATGNFIDQYLGAGWLCEEFDLDIKLALLDVPTFETQAKCSLSDIVDNVSDFYDDFSKGGWVGWIELTKPQNNFYGALLLAQDEKNRVEEEAKIEAETDAQMGEGFLGMKDCTWTDASGTTIAKQEDVRGTPKLPAACKPNAEGKTPGVVRPCSPKCEALTPSTVVNKMANKSVTNFYDQMNSKIGAATAKAGPFQIYVQAIANALINKTMQEGMGFLKSTFVDKPEYGDIGASSSIPEIADSQSIIQGRDDSISLSVQLSSTKEHLNDSLLKEQMNNLAVLKLIPPAYLDVIPDLENVIGTCSVTPYNTYVDWANAKIIDINNNTIPLYEQKINQMETVDIPKTINTINEIDIAILSIQEYINKSNLWLTVYEEVDGMVNDPKLQTANEELNIARDKVINDVQKPLEKINMITSATEISGFIKETQDTVSVILLTANDLVEQKGNPTWPNAGTLYAELEDANIIREDADEKTDTCQVWIAQQFTGL